MAVKQSSISRALSILNDKNNVVPDTGLTFHLSGEIIYYIEFFFFAFGKVSSFDFSEKVCFWNYLFLI